MLTVTDINFEKAYERQKQARMAAEELLESRSRALQSSYKDLEMAYEKMKSQKAQIIHQEKLASIGQLAAGVAHEINNPTGYVKSNVSSMQRYAASLKGVILAMEEVAKSDLSKEERSEKISAIKHDNDFDFLMEDIDDVLSESLEGLSRIEDIVKNLKNFARPDQGEDMTFDINECIEGALKLVNNEIKYKAEVKKELALELPRLLGQPGSMSQVFLNLIVNAAHAIEERGTITISTTQEEHNIIVKVSDTGCGIPEDLATRIFDPFFTTKEVGVGTGLGLSVSHGIISKHGGDISFESEIDKGTTFIISLPLNHGTKQQGALPDK